MPNNLQPFVERSIILKTDAYKGSHYLQYPKGIQHVFSYIEARGGMYPYTIFFGLQAFIKKYLIKPITKEDIDFAEYFWTSHIPDLQFNRKGWEYIVENHNGKLPIRIKAVKEGRKVTVRNVLVTVENTDPKCYWLPSYLETILLRGVWAPSTCATRSHDIKEICRAFLKLTSDITDDNIKLNWMLHDFGMRGAKSEESSGAQGAAHLLNFFGTDTLDGIFWANEYYNSGVCGFSIPASEHSTASMYGQNGEVEYVRTMIREFGKPGHIFANVGDSFDIFKFCSETLPQVKEELIASGATMIVRPDSGDPVKTPIKAIQLLADVFGYTTNSKGYKILNNVRVIQGDGINEQSIQLILQGLCNYKFSAENVFFGCGAYIQDTYNRDTQKWAMKCSSALIDNKDIDVYKEPISDPSKHSKRGKLSLVYRDSIYKTIRETELSTYISHGWEDCLDIVFEDGKLLREQTFEQIRSFATQKKNE